MAINWQKGTLFAAGIAVGVAGGVWGVMSLKDKHEESGPASQVAKASTMGAAAAPTSVVSVALPAGTCEQAPVLAKGDDGDGRESLQPKGGTASASEVSSMILGGKEAAAAGRPRDAEVFFLNACRQAASLSGNERIVMVDAMYQLGRHYANVAALGSPAKSKELFERAERLYSASLEAYTGRYGPTHEKTKFAQAGLTTVLQATGGSGVAAVAKAPPPPASLLPPVQVAQAAPPAAAPAPVVQAPPPPPVVQAPPPPLVVPAAPLPPVKQAAPAAPPAIVRAPPAVLAAPAPVAPPPQPAVLPAAPPPAIAKAAPVEAPKPAPAPQVAKAPEVVAKPVPAGPPVTVARRTSPSFDCAKARSTTEKLICGDEDLARMDRELGGMHQRAKQAAADARAFQRNSDAEWQKREATCRDTDCLRRWYAQRRQDLSTAPARVADKPGEAAQPVAQAAPRPAAPRPRSAAPQGPSEVTIAPGVASGDSGWSAPPAARGPSAQRQVDSANVPSAEGSPNAIQ